MLASGSAGGLYTVAINISPVGGGNISPAAFSFTNQSGVNLGATIVSNAVALSGFSGIASAVCNTGCTGIYRNGSWVGLTANFVSGDTIAIQQTSSSSGSAPTNATVSVGMTTSGVWTVTTGTASSNTPNAFSFANQTGVVSGAAIISNAVALSGFTGNLTATCGSGCTGIAVNGIWYFGSPASATVYPGNTIAIEQTSSTNPGTPTNASVTVGATASGTWTVTTAAGGDPCAGTPAIGTTCADGTLYAGQTPDGNVNMYVTPCDVGQTLSGGSCTGGAATKTWNDGSSNWLLIGGGVESLTSGKTNTANLIAQGTSPSPAPYVAAQYCGTLSAYGHGDWYLPSKNELALLYTLSKYGSGYGLNTTGSYYWSSTEYNGFNAWNQRFSDGNQYVNYENNIYLVRCARR